MPLFVAGLLWRTKPSSRRLAQWTPQAAAPPDALEALLPEMALAAADTGPTIESQAARQQPTALQPSKPPKQQLPRQSKPPPLAPPPDQQPKPPPASTAAPPTAAQATTPTAAAATPTLGPQQRAVLRARAVAAAAAKQAAAVSVAAASVLQAADEADGVAEATRDEAVAARVTIIEMRTPPDGGFNLVVSTTRGDEPHAPQPHAPSTPPLSWQSTLVAPSEGMVAAARSRTPPEVARPSTVQQQLAERRRAQWREAVGGLDAAARMQRLLRVQTWWRGLLCRRRQARGFEGMPFV